MEEFPIRGLGVILSGCGAALTLSRGENLAARRRHEPEPISNQLVGWGFYAARIGIDPGDLCLCPLIAGFVEVWRDSSSADKILSSPGAAGSRRWPERGNSRRALAP